jgi:hypothetical protein
MISITELLSKKSTKEISDYLDININTVKRWIEKGEIPKYYNVEILKFN